MQEQDMFDFKPSPPKPGREYPIGGYAPGNYICNCVTCKKKFMGDKRAVQCEPCAEKATEEIEAPAASPVMEDRYTVSDFANLARTKSYDALVKYDDKPIAVEMLFETGFVDGAKWAYGKIASPAPPIEPGEQKSPAGEIPAWFKKWGKEWLHKMECQGVDPRQREGFKKELEWAYWKINEGLDQVVESAVAFSRLSVQQANQLASARAIILDIKRGNIYQEPADECDKWLTNNPEIK